MKINEFLKNRKKIIVLVCAALVAVLLVGHTLFTSSILSAGNVGELQATSNINPRYKDIMEKGSAALTENTVARTENTTSVSTSTEKKTQGTTAAKTTAPATSKAKQSTTAKQATVPFATAIKPAVKADYSTQWNLGYLVAIDNPDTSYACARVTLSDGDRDLLERLCYGEFGSGGFIGAALIAQAVKDAMCFDGYSSVADVIKYCRYDGSTSSGTSEDCRQAVRYIFDENHDAVQHRIMYMYNPYMVQSAFHESQNFILSYSGVRFFDRWGY